MDSFDKCFLRFFACWTCHIFFITLSHVVCVIWNSKSVQLILFKLCTVFIYILNSRKTSVVCGDFNFDFYKSPDNVISNTLHGIGFQQVISDSTHIEGFLLDHIYTNIEPQSQFIHPVYFSDHDATCLILRI